MHSLQYHVQSLQLYVSILQSYVARGYSAFTVSAGQPSFGHAALKRFPHVLTKSDCKPISTCCRHPCTIYIFTRETGDTSRGMEQAKATAGVAEAGSEQSEEAVGTHKEAVGSSAADELPAYVVMGLPVGREGLEDMGSMVGAVAVEDTAVPVGLSERQAPMPLVEQVEVCVGKPARCGWLARHRRLIGRGAPELGAA